MMFVAVAATWARGHGVIIARHIALPKSVMLASRLERSASSTATAAQKATREAPSEYVDRARPASQAAAGQGVLGHYSKVPPWHENQNHREIRNEPYVADVTERP
jgi:hypothetical protein